MRTAFLTGCLLPMGLLIFAFFLRVIDLDGTSITYDELESKHSGEWRNLVEQLDFTSEKWAFSQNHGVCFSRWLFGVLPEFLWKENSADPYALSGARLIAAWLAAAHVVLIYFLGRETGGVRVGFVAAFIYSLFPAVLGHDRISGHDLPPRLTLTISLLYAIRYHKTRSWRPLLISAAWTGATLTGYFRIGIQSMMIIGAWMSWLVWIWRRENCKIHLAKVFIYQAAALLTGYILFLLTWPYAWTRPTEAFHKVFGVAAGSAFSFGGAFLEWFFGSIQPTPVYYYFAVFLFVTPVLCLLLMLAGVAGSWRKILRGNPESLILLSVLVTLISATLFVRQTLHHYIVMAFAGVCVLAGLGYRWIFNRLGSRFPRRKNLLGWMGILMLASLLWNTWRMHPYHLEFFNLLGGGIKGVSKNHTFMTGWYGEAINPLFEFVNKNAGRNATVICRLGPWPGMEDLKRNLRKDIGLQGYTHLDPLGPGYILLTGFETCSRYYRYCPDPRFYEKIYDLTVDGGSLGEVWGRLPAIKSARLLYQDDFSTFQCKQLIVNAQNCELNIHSGGKFFSPKSGVWAMVVFRLPSVFLQDSQRVAMEVDYRLLRGELKVFASTNPSKLAAVGAAGHNAGTLRTNEVVRPPKTDVYVALAWKTDAVWDGLHSSFWDYDWLDAFRVFHAMRF
ncbi:MAG: glycosyltransferase family 39 protein [Verrucomicrobiae bacterium]|nr:glycosyltransferase family 39 protein [Verrucomicrobiae bacterium]